MKITDLLEQTVSTVTGFKTAKGSVYKIIDGGRTIRNKAARPEHPGEVGIQPASERTFYVTEEDADKLGEIQVTDEVQKSIIIKNGHAAVRYEEGSNKSKVERRTVVKIRTIPAIGLTPIELWNNGTRVHFGNAITELF